MLDALECLPAAEATERHARLRGHLAAYFPNASGLLVFSRVHVYYFTGCAAAGTVWLPQQGEPVLLVRKGLERAKAESPLANILPFRSFSQLAELAAEAGSPLGDVVAVEGQGLSWNTGKLLESKLSGTTLLAGDAALMRTRAVKSAWELDKMRRAGELHHRCIREELPKRIAPGMTERDIALEIWDVFFAAGHCGLMRMSPGGDEVFLGHVSAGDSGTYSSAFNGPLGLRGQHPAVPVMGSAAKTWQPDELLSVDCAFALDGYHTDLTQVYTAQNMPPEAAEAQAFCQDVQAWIAENLKPGAIPSETYAHCVQWAERQGLRETFMGIGSNQVPFVGHGIGLTIDGHPVLAKKFDEPLEQGMVLAVEPKVGVPGYGMVGVENTFEVTPAGGRCLTAPQSGRSVDFNPIRIGDAG